MLAKLATPLRWLILAMCLANVFWQIYGMFWIGKNQEWTSLGLAIYIAVAFVLLFLNSVALLLPGSRTLQGASLLVVLSGFLLFVIFPHKISMF
jgi:hypothetical protein